MLESLHVAVFDCQNLSLQAFQGELFKSVVSLPVVLGHGLEHPPRTLGEVINAGFGRITQA